MQNVARKYKIYDHTRLSTEVVQAIWLKERNKWQLDVRKKDEESTETLYFDIL